MSGSPMSRMISANSSSPSRSSPAAAGPRLRNLEPAGREADLQETADLNIVVDEKNCLIESHDPATGCGRRISGPRICREPLDSECEGSMKIHRIVVDCRGYPRKPARDELNMRAPHDAQAVLSEAVAGAKA
jgi:hypothetical protein